MDAKLKRDLNDGWSKVSDYLGTLDRTCVDLDNDRFTHEEFSLIMAECGNRDPERKRSKLMTRYLKAWRAFDAKLLEISRADI